MMYILVPKKTSERSFPHNINVRDKYVYGGEKGGGGLRKKNSPIIYVSLSHS